MPALKQLLKQRKDNIKPYVSHPIQAVEWDVLLNVYYEEVYRPYSPCV